MAREQPEPLPDAWRAPTPDPSSGLDKTTIWRIERLQQLGFAGFAAELLVVMGADIHEAERLLKAGCPLDIAFEILRS